MSGAGNLAGGQRLRNGVCCRLRTSRAEFLVDGCVDGGGAGLAQLTLSAVGVGDGPCHSGHSTGGHAAGGAIIVELGNSYVLS